MDTFIFQPNQTALVREQHSSLRLHEGLHGTVIADHRPMLQRSDSSNCADPRGHTEFAIVTQTQTCSVLHVSSFHCMSIMVLAHLHHPVKAYQRESEDNRGEKVRQSFMPSSCSHPQIEKTKQTTEAAISTLFLLGSLALSSLLV